MKIRKETYGEALNIAMAKVKSKKNLIDTVNMLCDQFIKGELRWSKSESYNFSDNKVRIIIDFDSDNYRKVRNIIDKQIGKVTDKELINFLLINYIKHN